MLDSSTLTFRPYQDNRVKTQPGFIEGLSGPLMLATSEQGKKYIVKSACFHNAANELVGSWLGYKIGAPVLHSYLLKPSDRFTAMYGVAIGFIDGLQSLDKDHLTEQMKADICSQFALNILIDTDDSLQLNMAGGRVYSMDFAEAFYVSDTMMLKAFLFNEDAGISWMANKLGAFRNYLAHLSFDLPEFAKELNLDPQEMKTGIVAAAKKVLDITEDEIIAMSDELCEMYPPGYAVYYEECVHAMQNRMRQF
jgi:hypothetical protein